MAYTTTRRQTLGALTSLAALAATSTPLRAQAAWPSKPLKIVVPYPAGGSPDVFARQLGEELARQLGVTVIIDNKPGASGLLGMRAVSQTAADLHTFAYASSGQVTLTAMNPKFDLLKELKPVVHLSASPFIAVVNADSPIKTMGELIAAVQAQPGKLSFGSAGPGSPAHMAVEYLEESTNNFKALHVPFKGAIESINAILGGQIDFTIGVLGAAAPHIKAGKLRALGITTAKRSPLLPNVPTIAEGGGGNYAFQSWGGMMMHADTPDAVIARAATAFTAAMQSEAVKKLLSNTGSTAEISESPAAFAAQLRRDIATERLIVKRLGIVQD
jgi:tripartite-type tricarboxylate transporter receptor subunit TctC